MPPAVVATALARRYAGRWALRGVDLAVDQGRALMIAGRNGSGKTTLLRLLSSIARPSSGSLAWFGRPTADRARIALLSHADGHYDDLTALENLRLATADPLPHLATVGLADRAHDLVRTFSAGMRKRLAFARVLAKDAALVLLDEPYAALDQDGARLVDRLLAELRAGGRTLIVSTHQVDRARDLTDEAVLLDEGRVSWRGPSADLGRSD